MLGTKQVPWIARPAALSIRSTTFHFLPLCLFHLLFSSGYILQSYFGTFNIIFGLFNNTPLFSLQNQAIPSEARLGVYVDPGDEISVKMGPSPVFIPSEVQRIREAKIKSAKIRKSEPTPVLVRDQSKSNLAKALGINAGDVAAAAGPPLLKKSKSKRKLVQIFGMSETEAASVSGVKEGFVYGFHTGKYSLKAGENPYYECCWERNAQEKKCLKYLGGHTGNYYSSWLHGNLWYCCSEKGREAVCSATGNSLGI